MKTGSTVIDAHTIIEWARIVHEIWEDRIIRKRVKDTQALYKSLEHHVNIHADGNADRVDFFFLLYGTYVDMGVGRGYKRGNSGDLGFAPKREKKLWYSGAWYGQTKKLAEILNSTMGKKVANQIAAAIAYGAEDKMLQEYRLKGNARTMKNYYKRRALPGRWTKQHQWKPTISNEVTVKSI